MAVLKPSFDVPVNDKAVKPDGFFSDSWGWFFRSIFDRLYSLGIEGSFNLTNNQSSAADITGLKFNPRGVSQAVIEYCVQRVTTGSGAIEKIESGILIATYNPISEDWNLHAVNQNSPDDAGITFSIVSSGQVRYTTSNEAGDPLFSRIFWRARTLAGKSSLYSIPGAR